MKKVTLSRRQLEIAYEDEGTGETVVLLHAFPFDREMWRPQLTGLASDYRMIAPDFPGFGESGAPTEGFTVESMADIVADFLDAIGIVGTVIVAGLSMGGYVALAFAERQPQRLRGLILADTKAEPDDETAKAGRDALSEVARSRGASEVINTLLPKLVSERNKTAVGDEVRRIAERQKVPAIVQALLALKERPDATPWLTRITVPTLVIVGEQDVITPVKFSANLVERILGAVQVTIPDAGHLSSLEAPQAFNDAIRNFLHHPKK